MIEVTVCTNDENASLSLKRIQWFPIVGGGWEGLDIVLQVTQISWIPMTTSAAGIRYYNEARIIIYLYIDEWMLLVLVILAYHKSGRVQSRAREVLRGVWIVSHVELLFPKSGREDARSAKM